MSGEKREEVKGRGSSGVNRHDEGIVRLDTPDSLKNLTTQTLWWCGLFAFYPASRRLGGKKVETNDAFPWLPLFSSSAISRPGIRWGNTEAATSVSICSAGCCGVFGFCIDGHDEATWERGSKTNCSGAVGDVAAGDWLGAH